MNRIITESNAYKSDLIIYITIMTLCWLYNSNEAIEALPANKINCCNVNESDADNTLDNPVFWKEGRIHIVVFEEK